MKKRMTPSTGNSSKVIEYCLRDIPQRKRPTGQDCTGRGGAVGLSHAEKTLENKIAWVCSDCLKPRLQIYNRTISRCDSCLNPFSSPWEINCEKCHRIEHSEVSLQEGRVVMVPHEDAPTYRSWAWAKGEHLSGEDRVREWHLKRASRENEKKSEKEVNSA